MKSCKYLLLPVFLILSSSLSAEEIKGESKIIQATVYTDRAEVTREVTAKVPAGSHSIIIRGIPHNISAESIRAGGSASGNIIIRGVELKTIPLVSDVSEELESLTQKLSELSRQNQSLTRRHELLLLQQKLITGIDLNASVPSGENLSRPRTPEEIVKILNLMSETQKNTDPEIIETMKLLEENKKEIEAVRGAISKLQPQRRQETVLEIGVYSENPSRVSLEVAYQIHGAKWTPAYNLQVNESSREVKLERFALISQHTGEEWKDITLTLSTARPHAGLIRPEPSPFFIDIVTPVQEFAARRLSSGKASEMDFAGFSDLHSAPAQYQGAETLYGSVVQYRVPESVTLRSDGSSQKVFLATSNLSGPVYNIAAPALNMEVFREADLTNNSEAPILAGSLSVFNEGKFIGRRTISHIQPGQNFMIPLGVSDQIQVSRRLVKRFEDDPGIIRSFKRVKDDFEIELKNNSGKELKLIVLEPVPVSRNNKIKVQIAEERPRSLGVDHKDRLRNMEGILEWHQNLKPLSETKLRYSATVEYPADEQVSGMP